MYKLLQLCLYLFDKCYQSNDNIQPAKQNFGKMKIKFWLNKNVDTFVLTKLESAEIEKKRFKNGTKQKIITEFI